MQNIKRYAILSVLVMLFGIFSLLPAISLSMNNVVIRGTGVISTGAYARSGSAKDIQAAVDWVVANGGIGTVYIPNGTFNFVEVGQPWVTVEIPAGVNLFGALTEKSIDGQVIEWNTVLIMPYEVPEGYHTTFFRIRGEQDPNKTSRFSDIKLVGYREIDPDSTTRYDGVIVEDVIDFRIDHCYFLNLAGSGVSAWVGSYGQNHDIYSTCGVIDHCKFINTRGYVTDAWADCTVWYGVNVARNYYCEEWEADSSKVLGQYTNYTVFIEDCYFEKWRHCVASNYGAHYVFRHNTIRNDYGYDSLDAHGYGMIQDSRVIRGARATEVYDNLLLDPIIPPDAMIAIGIRGGGGVFFNNTVTGYTLFLYLSQEADDAVPECQIHDIYVWNNSIPAGCEDIHVWYGDSNPIEEGVDYFRHAPQTFTYEPCPYPHPLTIEAAS